MEKNLRATLVVNRTPVKLNPFVEEFLARTMIGAASSLKGAENVRSLQLYLERGNVRLLVNGNEIPLTPFPQEIIASTVTGLVSSLKGVDKIENLEISVQTH